MSHDRWRPRICRNRIVLLVVVALVIELTEFEDEEENEDEARGILFMQTKGSRL